MDNVTPFRKQQTGEPYGQGPARCLDCKHEWQAAAPVGTAHLDCGNCGGHRGMWKHPYAGKAGDVAFICNFCRSEHFYAVKIDGLISLKCAGCGADQTMAIWG